MLRELIIAGCGGFVGTAGRYLVGKWSAGMWHGSFPMGTFLVNVIGCFIVGLFFGLLENSRVMTPSQTVLLITGFCGGFTTFSSFANDMWILGNKGNWGVFALYLSASVVLGILCVWAGRAIIR
ncbi:MAG: fluoride efflux transporter CrcB [Bacteroides sp.]|nr:fluoride efflux transporter CrcB [Bacteroides sp.]